MLYTACAGKEYGRLEEKAAAVAQRGPAPQLAEAGAGLPAPPALRHGRRLAGQARTGKEFGRLEEKQLLWLNEDLHRNCCRSRCWCFLHHPPFDTGVGWLDKLKLANADGFWEIIPPYSRNILGVFAAHLHLQHTCLHRGVMAATCPAVSFQFSGSADSPRAALSEEPPGFNLIDLADGSLALRTVRFCPPKAPAEAHAAEAHRAETHHPGRPPADTARQA